MHISTSKIINKIIIKKKRKENGKREASLLSNPHSKEEVVSRSNFALWKSTHLNHKANNKKKTQETIKTQYTYTNFNQKALKTNDL